MTLSLLGAGPTSGAVFTPASISGLQAWWNPVSLAGTSNGAAITTWADSSGNSNTATGNLAKPTYSTSGINGVPAVAFNTQVFEIPQALVLLKPFTFACVVSVTNFTAAHRLLAGDQAGVIDVSTDVTTGLARLNKKNQVAIGVSTSAVTAATGGVLIVTYDASGNWAMYLDGTSIGSGTTNTTFSAAAGLGLLGATDTVGSTGLLGLMGDALLTNTVISAGDRASLQAYLKAKWGTP